MSRALIVIPARMQATRLPGKPLADINGEPMILHVWRRAVAAGAGPVVIATDSREIAAVIEAAGGDVAMTRSDHQSGSDRVQEAVARLDPKGEIRVVVNVQGDLPTLEPQLVEACVAALDKSPDADIATVAA
ncbi:MAG: NTP transferase domain-containing protein, partial [Pseudomonadota bacterium]|nr:NTP transferase domain-containing protein [Pseudomonadota bacterium]